MKTDNDFSSVMKQRSDAELVEIVTKLRDDYQPEALVAAEKELSNRNLTADKIEAAELEVEKKQKEIEQTANEPLEKRWRILCLMFPGIVNFFLAFVFKGQGQDRKFKEAWKWTFYGFGFYIGIIFLMIMSFWFLS